MNERTDGKHTAYDIKGPLVAKQFTKRNFEATYCPTKEEALAKALSYIPSDHVVSWGGSVSINEIGLRPYVLEQSGHRPGYGPISAGKSGTDAQGTSL